MIRALCAPLQLRQKLVVRRFRHLDCTCHITQYTEPRPALLNSDPGRLQGPPYGLQQGLGLPTAFAP